MTLQQGLAFALVGGAVAAFAWGRFRYDLVAVVTLLAGLASGVVPAKSAFDGFGNDITIIIGSALVVSAAVARSGVVEALVRPFEPRLKTEKTQVPALVGAVTVLSMATKNVGALAVMLPTALQISRRTGTSPSRLLMPMAFGSLLGGLVTLVGTSPNIIVSGVREQLLGKPFGMYDFAPVGIGLTVGGVLFLSFAYRLLPVARRPKAALGEVMEQSAYLTEAKVPEDWPLQARRIRELTALCGGDVAIVGLLRKGERRSSPHPNAKAAPGDTLLLEGEPKALHAFVGLAKLELVRANRPAPMEEAAEEVLTVEAVIGPGSSLIGESAQRLDLYGQYGVNLLAVSRSGYRTTQRLRAMRLRAGDVLVLQGGERTLPEALKALGALPLAERELRLGGIRRAIAPTAILAAAMLLVGLRLVPVSVAFFGAAVLMVAVGALRMRQAYAALDAPVLVLMACLIPVGEAVRATGGSDLIAGQLSLAFEHLPPWLALAATMAGAMAAAPFLHNAATVLIAAPIAVSLAGRLHLNPDPFLMAIAVGAACDFLTPVGHQCNTLVMGPGGYRFGDYARLGAPLSVFVLAVGTLLIVVFWPLAPH